MVRLQAENAAHKIKLALRMASKFMCAIFIRACVHSVACCVVVLWFCFVCQKKGRGFLVKSQSFCQFSVFKSLGC
jgi:hypothetical protein